MSGLLKKDTNEPINAYLDDQGILVRKDDRVSGIVGTATTFLLAWVSGAWAAVASLVKMLLVPASSDTAQVALHVGPSTTEGLQQKMVVKTVTPAAVATALFTFPAQSIPRLVLSICKSVLTGGGTTVTWSVGTVADPDAYGTAGYPTPADSLAKNSKSTWHGNGAPLAAAVDVTLRGAVAGGAADGDTALSVGSVTVVGIYDVPVALADV